LILTSGGLRRYVAELSVALAREFPEDSYTLLSDQEFVMPEGGAANLLRGSAAQSRRWWLYGIRRALREAGAQVFHGTNFEVPYTGGTPAVMTIHDLSPWRNPEWHGGAGRVRTRVPWLLRLGRARLVVTVSEAVRREAISHFGLAEERVRAVPLAASQEFRPVAVRAAERPFFLFVGTLEPRKNLAGLIEAWRATRGETGADLAIAGRTRADFGGVVAEPGLRLLGEVSEGDLAGLYSQALASVYPSHYEGFGLPVLEAMQCGCPVIASPDPALREVSGGSAIHTDDLAEALREVARNAELRDRMRVEGLARATAFSWAKTARATRAVYEEAML
jgi:alpha-1,3-rhamnosyl/mannosyltransferase